MSTLLHAVFILIFGHADFVTVVSNIRGRKTRFSESSENSIPEKSIFVQFEVILLNV